MQYVHRAFQQQTWLENQLRSSQQRVEHLESSPAAQSRKALAESDELALDAKKRNDELDWWLTQFQTQQDGFKDRLEGGLNDAMTLQKIMRDGIIQDKKDQAERERRMKATLVGKAKATLAAMSGKSNT